MKLEVKKADLIFAGIVWLVLSLSFAFNFFGVGLNIDWFEGFQKDSSLIVEKTAICKKKLPYSGPVIPGSNHMDYMKDMASDDCTPGNYAPYDSQFGLQARTVALFAPGTHIRTYFHVVETMLAIATALVLTLVIIRVKQIFGNIAAVTSAGFIAVSVWIVGYARNLYWVEPLMITPFALSFIAYPWFKRTGRLWVFYAIEAVLIFAKLLDGYEHITTISLSIFVPIVFYELMTKGRRIIDLWKPATVVVAITVIGFISAFAVNVAALSTYYGSPSEAIAHIERRSEARSLAGIKSTKKDVVLNFEATLPSVYRVMNHHIIDLDVLKDGQGALVKYVAISTLNYALLPAITIPVSVNGLIGVLLQSILFWSVMGYLAIRRLRHSVRFGRYHRAFFWSYIFSLAGSLSWLAMMPGHAFPHAHLNGIVFYIPHLILCYLAVGVAIADYRAQRHATGVRK